MRNIPITPRAAEPRYLLRLDYLETDIVSQLVRAIRRQAPPAGLDPQWRLIRLAAFFSLSRDKVQDQAFWHVFGLRYNAAGARVVDAAWKVVEDGIEQWRVSGRRPGLATTMNGYEAEKARLKVAAGAKREREAGLPYAMKPHQRYAVDEWALRHGTPR